jgi:hypothetical protein
LKLFHALPVIGDSDDHFSRHQIQLGLSQGTSSVVRSGNGCGRCVPLLTAGMDPYEFARQLMGQFGLCLSRSLCIQESPQGFVQFWTTFAGRSARY